MIDLTLQQEDSVVTVTDDEEHIIVAWRGGPVMVTWHDGRSETKIIDDSVYVSVQHVPVLIDWLQSLLREREA